MTTSTNDTQQKLQELDERIAARSQAIRVEHDWWPCQRGCDQCCRQLAHPPELSSEEWVRVDEAVAKLAVPTRAEIEMKINALLLQIAEEAVGSHVVCPYLNESEGACHIYEARPVACRTYGFFVARDHDQYCQLIETEVASRPDQAIVWGNAAGVRREIEQISGAPIPFNVHYSGS